jgi:predicted ribosomally synthesized peptide with SipW-like signal peptide
MTKAKRRSTTKKLVASTALVGGALALAFGGAFASFTDTVSAGPQTISSGTIQISTGPTDDSGTGATGIVPGDTIAREIDLNSTNATATAASITLGFTATTSSLLDQDATNGLQVSAQSCATKPTRTAGPPPTYTCSGGWTAVTIGGKASTSVSALETTAGALSPLNSLSPNKQDYLLFTLSFPSAAPGDLSKVTACSGTAGGTSSTENLEGCTSVLKYTFVAIQRAGSSQ